MSRRSGGWPQSSGETVMRLMTALLPSLAASAAMALSGCGWVRPDPMSLQETVVRARADRTVIEAAYVPVNAPLTLSDALARALKYNYDAALAKAEINLQERQLDL